MRSTMRRRMERLGPKDDELVELPTGERMTMGRLREGFKKVLSTPDTIPVQIDPGVAKNSNF